MGKYDFKSDLIIGEEGEKVVVQFLESKGSKLIKDNKDNKYDIIMKNNDKEISYEIKTDIFCKPDLDNGNIFIEFECRGKPSGIKVTNAKWFVTYFKHYNELWFIRTSKLNKLLLDNNFKETSNSGDAGSNTRGYLINRFKFKKEFKIFNTKTNLRIF